MDGHSYMAISHGWSDGLGNEQGNFLPGCQVQGVYFILTAASWTNPVISWTEDGSFKAIDKTTNSWDLRPLVFWIDTLCVPHTKELRNLALQRIYRILTGTLQRFLFSTPSSAIARSP